MDGGLIGLDDLNELGELNGSWLLQPATKHLIFDVPAEQLWQHLLTRLCKFLGVSSKESLPPAIYISWKGYFTRSFEIYYAGA